MRHTLSILLSLALVISLVLTAFAATPEAVEAANALYSQGLFNGIGKDAGGNPIFELDRAPTRHEAVTMLVRLLGKEAEARSGTWTTPFTDVAEWAIPYVGYAYANSLVAGTSATTFSGNDNVTAAQYLTLVLRTLGYESGTDFQWDKAWELSDKIGLTDGRYNASTVNFTRGDVAIISKGTRNAQKKIDTPAPIQLNSYSLSKNSIGEPKLFISATNITDSIVKAFSLTIFAYDSDGVPVKVYFNNFSKGVRWSDALKAGATTDSNGYWQLYGEYNKMKQFVVILCDVEFYDGTTWQNPQYSTLYDKYNEKLLNANDENILPRA